MIRLRGGAPTQTAIWPSFEKPASNQLTQWQDQYEKVPVDTMEAIENFLAKGSFSKFSDDATIWQNEYRERLAESNRTEDDRTPVPEQAQKQETISRFRNALVDASIRNRFLNLAMLVDDNTEDLAKEIRSESHTLIRQLSNWKVANNELQQAAISLERFQRWINDWEAHAGSEAYEDLLLAIDKKRNQY